ncbi:MAG: metal ABC transporter substrate-binding protein [Anaerolineaceae bacterium]|nr:metal ABC transporter substrate-binding protein [Anaerolineaceae bacterium]
MIVRQLSGKIAWRIVLLVLLILLIGCSSAGTEAETAVPATTNQTDTELLTLPSLAAAELNGEPLQVIASTSIIGDVVAQVGGDAIALTTLMMAGQDPHSYEPGAQTLTAVAQADVIFINGWDLEESLVHDLETIGEDVPVVAISANIEPLTPGEEDEDEHEDEEEHEHRGADPHVWFDIQNVIQWTENAAQVLAALDPDNADVYQVNATAYKTALADLEAYVQEQLATLPAENRVLVTNHDSFGYFAQAYDFEILGTVVPGSSTIAEPSAADLTALIGTMEEHGVCTIFTETTVSDSLSQTVAAELDECEVVQVVPLYTGAIGPAGSGAESYIDMFRANVEAIVAGLK